MNALDPVALEAASEALNAVIQPGEFTCSQLAQAAVEAYLNAIAQAAQEPPPEDRSEQRQCYACGGKGRFESTDGNQLRYDTCQDCNGDGWIVEPARPPLDLEAVARDLELWPQEGESCADLKRLAAAIRLALPLQGERIRTVLDASRPARDNLIQNQRQLDQDGVEVGVSRQAVDEVVDALLKLSDMFLQSPPQLPKGETWIEKWRRLGLAKDWAGRLAMLRAPQ